MKKEKTKEEDKVEVIKFYHKEGKEYQRDMHDGQGNWIGIETQTFISEGEALLKGYKLEANFK